MPVEANEQINIFVDKETRDRVQFVLASEGMTIAQSIRMFLRSLSETGRLCLDFVVPSGPLVLDKQVSLVMPSAEKRKAQEVLASMGVDMRVAVRSFLRSVDTNGVEVVPEGVLGELTPRMNRTSSNNSQPYRSLVHTPYQTLSQLTVRNSTHNGVCVWCTRPLLSKDKVLFCTEEHKAQYLVRALPEEMRKAVRLRDAGICAWCGRDDMHYALVNKVAPRDGGGACGVEEMMTLCSGCIDGYNPISPQEFTEVPSIPEMLSKKKWTSPKACRKHRHLAAPLMESHARWSRALAAWKENNSHFGILASQRTHEHSRVCTLSLRWWKLRSKARLGPKKRYLAELINMTIFDLEAQLRATALWIIYMRRRNTGYLD